MIRTVHCIIIGLLAFTTGLKAQSSLPFDILLETQAQIDSFPVLYPNCTVIEGNLEINGWDSGGDYIFNLDSLYGIHEIQGDLTIMYTFELNTLRGLEGITHVRGKVYVSFTSVDSLTGLDNLQFVGKSLQLGENNYMRNLHALKRLKHVGDGLGFWFCDLLQNLDGLDSLSYIGNYLIINGNNQFSSMEGLGMLSNISGYLEIENLPLLTNLHGLEAIDSIAENLTLIDNESLYSLSGLNNLKYVGGGVFIRENPSLLNIDELIHLKTLGYGIDIESNASLQNISGLASVTQINNQNIYITSNPLLTDISGIRNIDATSIYYLEITFNPLLMVCAYESTCDFLQNNLGPRNIGLNAQGCNSDSEILFHCQYLGEAEVSVVNEIQIIPSPVVESALIRFRLPEPGNVKLDIINSLGEVATPLLNQILPAGEHTAVWQPGNLPVGFYICRLQYNNLQRMNKILYIPQ
jgi:hypothetical protein